MMNREKIVLDHPVVGHIDVHMEYHAGDINSDVGLEDDVFDIGDWYASKFGAYCSDSGVTENFATDLSGEAVYTNFKSLSDAKDFADIFEQATGQLAWLDFIEVGVDTIIDP